MELLPINNSKTLKKLVKERPYFLISLYGEITTPNADGAYYVSLNHKDPYYTSFLNLFSSKDLFIIVYNTKETLKKDLDYLLNELDLTNETDDQSEYNMDAIDTIFFGSIQMLDQGSDYYDQIFKKIEQYYEYYGNLPKDTRPEEVEYYALLASKKITFENIQETCKIAYNTLTSL